MNETLEKDGLSLSGQPQESLLALLDVLEDGLGGRLPRHYYLASLDPGIGKTLAVCSFLKVWKKVGYEPDSSILVGVSRLGEIEGYVRRSGLTSADFGVLTSSSEHNALGVEPSRHGAARILFTTQQMILSRSRGRAFGDASEFHYQGQPRALRLWDETFLPADPEVITRHELVGLAPLSPYYPDFIDALGAFTRSLTADQVGRSVRVPEALIDLLPAPREVGLSLGEGAKRTLESLAVLSGSTMLLIDDPRYRLTLVGSSVSLPDDFAPVIILDASGRVRETYRLWEKYRRNLIRLPHATNDYRNLGLHVWETAAGKGVFNKPGGHQKFLGPIAELINADDDSCWLVVCYKATSEKFLASLRAMITANGDQRVHGLTWGRHHGTNEYRDIENVIVIGHSAYRSMDYIALQAAASGLRPNKLGGLAVAALKRGEYRHQLLQALCRASVRKSTNGIAGRCAAYVIATPSSYLTEDLETTFPGAIRHEWQAEDRKLSGNALQALEYLMDRFADDETNRISKRQVREAIGLRTAQAFTHVMNDEAFCSFLFDCGLTFDTRYFRRLEPVFDAIPDEEA